MDKVLRGGVKEITQIEYTPSYTTSNTWSISLEVPVKFITLSTDDTGGVLELIDVERGIRLYSTNTSSYRGGRFNIFQKIDNIHQFNSVNTYNNVVITISDDFKTVSGNRRELMVSIWG